MRGDGARRIGAGEHDGAERLVAEARTSTGSMRSSGASSTAWPRARSALRGALAVGLRPGDQEAHASHRREEIGAGALP